MIIIKDNVDELLKADAAFHRDQQVDDAGFTLRLIDNLPATSRNMPAVYFTIPFAFTLFAAIFVVLFSGAGNLLIDAAMDIATNSMSKSAAAFISIVGILVAVSISAESEG